MSDMALLTFAQTSAKTACGRTRIYSSIAAGTFPKPVRVGCRSLWVKSEVEQWIADRIADRDMGENVGRRDAA